MPHDTPAAIHAKQEKEQQLNGPLMYAPDQALQAPPSYKIYIYNLLPLQWPVAKGSAGNFTILACEPGEPYSGDFLFGWRIVARPEATEFVEILPEAPVRGKRRTMRTWMRAQHSAAKLAPTNRIGKRGCSGSRKKRRG